MDPAKLLEEALGLPAEARAALAAQLIASLDGTVDEGAEAARSEVIARRLEELTSGRVTTIPWESARRQLLSALDGQRSR